MVPTPEKLRGFCLVFHPRRQLSRLAPSSQLSSYQGGGQDPECGFLHQICFSFLPCPFSHLFHLDSCSFNDFALQYSSLQEE